MLTARDLKAAGLRDELAAIEDAVGTHLAGSHANAAVIAEPYAGRDVLLSYRGSELGAAAGHVAFEEPVTDPGALNLPNREVVFVEGYVTARDLDEEYGDVERVVYERLAKLAEGDPGVALSLWADAVADGEVSPAALDEHEDPLDLDNDEADALTAVLCKERLSYDALDRLLDDAEVGRAVQTLVAVEFYVDPESDVARARDIVAEAMRTSRSVCVTDDLRHEFLFRTDVTGRALNALTATASAPRRSPKPSPGPSRRPASNDVRTGSCGRCESQTRCSGSLAVGAAG